MKRNDVIVQALGCLTVLSLLGTISIAGPPVPDCPPGQGTQQFYGRVYYCKDTLDCPPWAQDRWYWRVCTVKCCYPSGGSKYVLWYQCGQEYPGDTCCAGGVANPPPPPPSYCP